MAQAVRAIYEDGMLRPLEPLDGVADHSEVRLVVHSSEPAPHPLADCVGILPDEDAHEMSRIIEDEFEQIDADTW